MGIDDLHESLGIFKKYSDGSRYNISAEHDQIWVHGLDPNKPVKQSDLERLIDLGWHQDDVDVQSGTDFGPEHYDPECVWSHYT